MQKKISDITDLQNAVNVYINKTFDSGKIKKVVINRYWLNQSKPIHFWEIEGIFELKSGFFSSKTVFYRMQIEAETGRVIGWDT